LNSTIAAEIYSFWFSEAPLHIVEAGFFFWHSNRKYTSEAP